MSERYAYILINDEKWWNRRRSQNEAGKALHAFVRKGIVGPKKADLVLFYVKYPIKEIHGFGEFVERVTGATYELWNTYGHETVFASREEYMDFMQGRIKATFIRFKNLRELSRPVPASVISDVANINRMPRSGKYIGKEETNQLIFAGESYDITGV